MTPYQRGQIALPLLISVASIVAAPIIGFFGAQMATADKISKVSERVVTLETLVPEIRDDVKETKADVKDIKNALNIR